MIEGEIGFSNVLLYIIAPLYLYIKWFPIVALWVFIFCGIMYSIASIIDGLFILYVRCNKDELVSAAKAFFPTYHVADGVLREAWLLNYYNGWMPEIVLPPPPREAVEFLVRLVLEDYDTLRNRRLALARTIRQMLKHYVPAEGITILESVTKHRRLVYLPLTFARAMNLNIEGIIDYLDVSVPYIRANDPNNLEKIVNNAPFNEDGKALLEEFYYIIIGWPGRPFTAKCWEYIYRKSYPIIQQRFEEFENAFSHPMKLRKWIVDLYIKHFGEKAANDVETWCSQYGPFVVEAKDYALERTKQIMDVTLNPIRSFIRNVKPFVTPLVKEV